MMPMNLKHTKRSAAAVLPTLAGVTLLLCPSVSFAFPQFLSPLFAPPTLLTNLPTNVISSPEDAGLPPTEASSLLGSGFGALSSTSLFGPFWPLPLQPKSVAPTLFDPSLRLTDWRHVFNVSRLGEFDIPLRTDPAERTNVLLAAQAVNDVTVAPGETFSFNETVGERTPQRGYQDGLMFDQGRVIRGTGGGICLVSTGLYNAALQAGLVLVERHPHSGVVNYAPPGCDAGVVYGVEDMKFRNTTPVPVVIKTRAEEDRVVIELFGQIPPPGQKIFVKPTRLDMISPRVIVKTDPTLAPGETKVAQRGRSGYDVTVERFWTKKGRIVRDEVVTSEHRAPRSRILLVALPPKPIPAPDTLPLAPMPVIPMAPNGAPLPAPSLPNEDGSTDALATPQKISVSHLLRKIKAEAKWRDGPIPTSGIFKVGNDPADAPKRTRHEKASDDPPAGQ